MSDVQTEPTMADLHAGLAQLEDLFRRRLLEDRQHKRMFEQLEQQLSAMTAMATGTSLLPLVHPLLQVIDRLEGFREDPPDTKQEALDFVDSVIAELVEALLRNDVAQVVAEGPFDPSVHEAVGRRAEPVEAHAAEGAGAGLVIGDVVRHGYQLGAKVIRPAKVVVQAGPATQGSPAADHPPAIDDL